MINIEYNSGAIDASGAVSQAWELIKKNYWMYFGIALLAYVLIACIPIANIFLMGPVLTGVYFVMLRERRGEPVDFGMMFKGFEKFVPAMVIGLIQSVPGIIIQIVQFSMNIGSNLLTQPGRGGRRGEPDLDVLLTFLGAYMAVIGGLMLFSFVWHALFMFALPLMAEYDNLGPIDAIKYSFKAAFSNIGGLILLIIFEMLILFVGGMALCIGVFFVMPLYYAIILIAYKQVFPGPAFTPQNSAPPTPDQYGGSYGQGM